MNHSYIRQHIKGLIIRTNKVNPDNEAGLVIRIRLTRPQCIIYLILIHIKCDCISERVFRRLLLFADFLSANSLKPRLPFGLFKPQICQIWPFLKLFARNKMVWPFFECLQKQYNLMFWTNLTKFQTFFKILNLHLVILTNFMKEIWPSFGLFHFQDLVFLKLLMA